MSLSDEAGGVNKVHDKKIFGKVADQIVEIRDLTYQKDPENPKLNLERFTQILVLTLDTDDKKNVLDVILYLMSLKAVRGASPCINYDIWVLERSN